MITYRRTSIMESTAQTLVNTVNCVGVMGKGIAKEFKERDPAMYRAYKKICSSKTLEPGKLWLWQGAAGWILNFPTKVHWRSPSKLEWIEAGLKKFVSEYADRGITEISFPRLGCGNGNLDWDAVKPLMESYLIKVNIPVYIHDHMVDIGLPEHLEDIPNRIRAEGTRASTFGGFLDSIKLLSEIDGIDFVELDNGKSFQVRMDDEENLFIKTAATDLVVEREDLRGIWLSLISGLVTRERAGWSSMEGSGPLLSILSMLPIARPIQIQRLQQPSELAVELRVDQARNVITRDSTNQSRLEWA